MIKKSWKFVHAFLVFLAIALPPAASAYAREIVLGSIPDFYTFKPQNVVYPGFIEGTIQRRQDNNGGFSGFLSDIRNFVRTSVGASQTDRFREASRADRNTETGATNSRYEPPFPIEIGQASRRGNRAEISLGFSIREILLQIFSTGTTTNEKSLRGGGIPSPSSQTGWFDNWFRGVSQPTQGSDLWTYSAPSVQPNYVDDLPLVTPRPRTLGDEDGVIALRKKVLALLFNPFVFFSLMIILILFFMSRFRNSTA